MKQLILFASAVLLLLIAGFSGMAESADHTDSIEVVVKPGDTLWQIANQYYDDRFDTRLVIAHIKAHNNLTESIIHPGETLQLPRY